MEKLTKYLSENTYIHYATPQSAGTPMAQRIHCVCISHFPEVLDVMAEHATLQPDSPEAIFGAHVPHFTVEIFSMAASAEKLQRNLVWAQKSVAALRSTNPKNVVLSTDPPWTPMDDLDLRLTYGSRYDDPKGVKQKHDGGNVFKHTVIQLG
ncbi:FAD-binding domain-containing protein [Penicillium maclennaniae]|uniref:FAD-binding domain-containing protein n=1 Tax=Penicillium maclennaniae TaxID=1343394 RepID=UPI00253FCE50|nr:FAD-binding domain-containing protein [Penicillium maclennaniae]KAJ5681342.1 FAD-binding domain-containing protein [Penicillium maclennaniae]